jgi:hypothetical protein
MRMQHVGALARTVTTGAAPRVLAGPAALSGGLLWVPYGVGEMLQPWGEDTRFLEELGYEIIVDLLLFRVYSLPGSLALLLCTLALLGGFGRRNLPERIGRAGRILASAALVLAALSIAGVVVSFDPLFTAPRIFGTLALGAATTLAAIERGRADEPWSGTALLLTVGLLGLFLLPLWPLVFAVEVMPAGVGAAVLALFGLGWMLLGYRLWAEPS